MPKLMLFVSFCRFGSSGDMQIHNTMCILPINILNEKIYVFLWFWFIILAVLSGLALIYRLLIVFFPRFRLMVSRLRARRSNKDNLKAIISKSNLGDWLMLNLLSKNLDPLNYRDIINEFARTLEGENLKDV